MIWDRGFALWGLLGEESTKVSSRAKDATEPARECVPRLPRTLAGFLAEASVSRLGDGPGRLTQELKGLTSGNERKSCSLDVDFLRSASRHLGGTGVRGLMVGVLASQGAGGEGRGQSNRGIKLPNQNSDSGIQPRSVGLHLGLRTSRARHSRTLRPSLPVLESGAYMDVRTHPCLRTCRLLW